MDIPAKVLVVDDEENISLRVASALRLHGYGVESVSNGADAVTMALRFVADAGHELRTPLTTLQGYSALYAVGGLADSAAVADAMRRINAEATRMNGIVSDLLEPASLGDHSTLQVRRFVRLRSGDGE